MFCACCTLTNVSSSFHSIAFKFGHYELLKLWVSVTHCDCSIAWNCNDLPWKQEVVVFLKHTWSDQLRTLHHPHPSVVTAWCHFLVTGARTTFAWNFNLIWVHANAKVHEQKLDFARRESVSKAFFFFHFLGGRKVIPAPCSLLTFLVAPAYGGCRMNPHHSWERLDNKCEAVRERWIK